MRKTLIIGIAILCTLFTFSCKKSDSNGAPTPFIQNTASASYLVLKEWGVQRPDRSFDEFFYFMNLSADDNAGKKYIKTRRLYANSDSLEIIDGPNPISSLTDTWPATVKTGCSNQWITDFFTGNNMRVTQNGIIGGKRVYTYGSIGIGYNFPYGAPEGETSTWIPDGTGSGKRVGGYFYFKQELYVDNSTLTAKPISGIVVGANAYDWKNVDAVFAYITSPGFFTNVFIDYKNWRYFTLEETCAAGPLGACTQKALVLHPYKSLDKLMKWPASWKKP